MSGRCAVLLLVLAAGCKDASVATPRSAEPVPTAHHTRAARAAFPGAPPVIPHPPLSGKCVTCHTRTGSVQPGLGLAPANPHADTAGMSEESRCRQCHLFQQTKELFAHSDFSPLRRTTWRGARAFVHAPPTVPHPEFMREDCAACHAGPAARTEIRCSHPERFRCQQCHVQAADDSPAAREGSELTRLEWEAQNDAAPTGESLP